MKIRRDGRRLMCISLCEAAAMKAAVTRGGAGHARQLIVA